MLDYLKLKRTKKMSEEEEGEEEEEAAAAATELDLLDYKML